MYPVAMRMSNSSLPRLANMIDHALIGDASKITVNAPAAVISVSPIVLPAPDRIIDLHLRVSVPITGKDLPIIIFSHGQGPSNNLSSLNGYGPLVNFWAAHGFAVIQPTHLSSKSLSLSTDIAPEAPSFFRSRATDIKLILDNLDLIEESFPQIRGRLDHSKVAVAGHSMGGSTASLILGAHTIDPIDGSKFAPKDPRVKVGVLLAAPGDGRDGASVGDAVKENYKFLATHSHADMDAPTLVVIGDEDGNPWLTNRGAAYHADAYHFSKGPKSLLTLSQSKHCLGGISGYDAAEASTEESPEGAAVVQRMTWAYLHSHFYPEDQAWSRAIAALEEVSHLGKVESK